MIFTLVWVLFSLMNAFGALYLQGRSNQRLKDDPQYMSDIPWFAGVFLCWLGPLLAAGAGIGLAARAAYKSGTKDGLAFNQEMKVSREFMKEFNETRNQTMLMIQNQGVDPANLDAATVNQLNAASVVWSMAKEQQARDDEARRHVRKAIEASTPTMPDPVFADILTKQGVVIPRTSELDLA